MVGAVAAIRPGPAFVLNRGIRPTSRPLRFLVKRLFARKVVVAAEAPAPGALVGEAVDHHLVSLRTGCAHHNLPWKTAGWDISCPIRAQSS